MTQSHPVGVVPSSADQLVRDFYQPVQYFAQSILNDPDDADDVAQEALIVAMSSLSKYRGESSFKTWLFSITLNLCRQHFRKLRSRRTLATALQAVEMTAGQPPAPEDIVSRHEADRRLWAAVDALDEEHRTAIVLRYVHDLEIKEIAFITRTKEGTVHSRLHRARLNLQRMLADKEGKGWSVR
jgi:RNA polymerase sigma-70 factor (ECF subfamily)